MSVNLRKDTSSHSSLRYLTRDEHSISMETNELMGASIASLCLAEEYIEFRDIRIVVVVYLGRIVGRY